MGRVLCCALTIGFPLRGIQVNDSIEPPQLFPLKHQVLTSAISCHLAQIRKWICKKEESSHSPVIDDGWRETRVWIPRSYVEDI